MITKENLDKFDYFLVIDRSTSMTEPANHDEPNGINRWDSCKELAHGVAREAAKHDDDGITLIFFANEIQVFDNIGGGTDKELALKKLDELFETHQPNGGTHPEKALQWIFDRYIAAKRKNREEVKPLIVILVTDGEPNEPEKVTKCIVDFTKKLENEDEAGLQFLQIGDDEHARGYLKLLDEELTKRYGAKFDIVATRNMKELDNMSLEAILLTSVND